MISEKEAQDLMKKFIYLREKANKSNSVFDVSAFRAHEKLCIEKFKYLISMRTDKYKGFYNYDDLNQEGLEALVKAMKSYNPSKGNFFWWGHKYIETRIARSANLHTTIRYPLKYAKLHSPRKEQNMPMLIEKRFCPDLNLEAAEICKEVKNVMTFLTKEQQTIITLFFGFGGDKPMSINRICKTMKMTRANCINIINDAIVIIRENIHI